MPTLPWTGYSTKTTNDTALPWAGYTTQPTVTATVTQPIQLRIAGPIPRTTLGATKTTPLAPGFEYPQGVPTIELTPDKDLALVLGESLKRLPIQLGATILQAVQGINGPSVVDRDWADRYIAAANTDMNRFVEEIRWQYPGANALQEVSRLSQNLAYSLTSMGTGTLAALPLWLTPEFTGATKAAAAVITGTISGIVAYRMTTYQIVQQYLEFKDAEKRQQTGQGLTLEEEKQLKTDFNSKAVRYGLWEAVPEGIGNMLFSGILTGAFTNTLVKVVGQTAAKQIATSMGATIATKATSIYGEELLTEMITQKGQSDIEVEAGLREGRISWWQALKEIAPQTFLLTTLMAGAGQTVISSTNAIKKAKTSLKNEIGEEHSLYTIISDGIESEFGQVMASAEWTTTTGEMPGYVQQDVLSQAELWLQQVPEIKPSYLHVIGIPEGEAFVRTDSKGNPLIAGTSLMRDGQLTLSTIVSAQPNTLTSARALIDVGNYIKENNIAFPPREEMSPDAIRIYDKLQGKVPEYAPTTAMAEWGTTTGKVIPVTPEVTGMEEIKVGLEILKRPLKVSPLKGKKLTPVRSITDKPGQTSMRVPLDEVVVTEPIPGGEKTFWYNEKRIILTPEQQQLVLKPEVTFPKAEAGMPKVTGGIVPPTSGLEAIDTSTAEGAAVAEVAGTPPSKPPTNWDKVGGDLYDSFMNRITRNPTPNTVPKTDRLKRARGKVERVISDEFARLNKLGWDAEVSVAMTKAARGRAGEMYRQVMNNVGRTLGWNSELIGHVNNYLILRHQLEVLKAIGGKHFTIISGGQTQQFTAKQLGLIFARMKKELGAVNYEKVKKAAPYVPALYNEILKSTDELTVAQIEGLHKKYPWYVPIIYADETTPINLLKGKKLNPRQIKRLTQWDTDKEILDPLITLPNSIIRRVEAQTNNKAIMEVARAAVDPKNKVYIGGDVEISKKPQGAFIGYWDKGQHLYLNLGKGAEWIVEDIKLIQTQPFSMIMRAVRSLQGLSKATFTTYNPLFMVSNTAFDAVTSFWTEGVKPWEFVSAWAARIKSIFTDVERVNISRLMGSEQLGFFTKGAEIGGAREVTPFVVKEKGRLRLRNPQSLKRLANPFVLIREVGEAGENAARDVVTQKALKEGLSNDEAGLRGRRVTVDFGRFGTASRQINNWYLYLNAGLQGFLLPGRAVAKNPRSLWRLGLLIAGYIGLTLYNQSYDEYPDVQDSDKVGKLLIMLPSNEYNQYGQKVPHYISLIPMREFATITAPIEYLLGRLMTEDPEAYRTLAQEWGVFYPVVSPISMITETGGLELPTQVASTIQQIITNHDTFRDKPIIDDEMSILPPALQYDKYTNSLAIRIGQAINVSPKRLDFFVSNMFGSMGNEFLRSIDLAIQQIDRELVDERIANLVEQLRAIPTQVPPNQIGVARETFLEGLAIEDRDLVLNMERLPEEKIPFIESAIRRFYRDWGGQVYQTAKEKALANRTLEDYPDKALEELQKAAVLNANNFLKGKVTKQEYDNARTNYRAYYSGASSAEWREAMIEGAVARSEVDKYLPESYQRSEEFQALSAYMEIRQGFIDDAGGILNSDVWDEIEEKTLIELKLHYSDRAIQYAIAHKDDWIDKLPEPARTVERQRAIAIENETWWDDYRGQTSNLPWSGGGDTTTPWGGGTTNNLPWSGYSSK